MKNTVDIYQFRNEFQSIRPNNFTYEGLSVLFDYLEELEQSCGDEIELDVIALCCDFSEDHYEDIASNYDIDLSECEDDDEKLEAVKDYLLDHGHGYCGVTEENNIIYQVF